MKVLSTREAQVDGWKNTRDGTAIKNYNILDSATYSSIYIRRPSPFKTKSTPVQFGESQVEWFFVMYKPRIESRRVHIQTRYTAIHLSEIVLDYSAISSTYVPGKIPFRCVRVLIPTHQPLSALYSTATTSPSRRSISSSRLSAA